MPIKETVWVVEYFKWTPLTSDFKTSVFSEKDAAIEYGLKLLEQTRNENEIYDDCFEQKTDTHVIYVEFDNFRFTIKIGEKGIL